MARKKNKSIEKLEVPENILTTADMSEDLKPSLVTNEKESDSEKEISEELNKEATSAQREADEDFYFEIVEEANLGNYATLDLKDKIVRMYEEGKALPKDKWRKIRFLTSICDPIVGLKKFEKVMAKAIAKNDRRELIKLETLKEVNNLVWGVGTVVKVPPNVAEFYVSMRYFVGYEGFGDPSQYTGPNVPKPAPKYRHVAEYVIE